MRSYPARPRRSASCGPGASRQRRSHPCRASCDSSSCVSTALGVSFADDLYKYTLLPAAVELAVEDLLPRTEVELPLGDRHHDLTPHDLAFQVGVGVVFP